tara:strand:+ start:152 stop:712 length:561 start_codon:yes stop_codon:yes gene_type:complete
MSRVLYYSNYCSHCKNILTKLTNTKIKSDIHFLCIDKRFKIEDKVYIILENGDKILLPNQVNKVPALMLLYKKNELLYGDEIHNHFDTVIKTENVEKMGDPRVSKVEPQSFSMNDVHGFVKSDVFSFLDMSSEELAAKGDGGMRNMYNYGSINGNEKIFTPPEDYKPNKVDEGEIKKYQEERAQIK